MRTAATQTSARAFHGEVQNFAGFQRQRIIEHITNSNVNWTIGELAHALGMEKSTASARINELLKSGELVACESRKDRRSGITARPVALPKIQRVLF